MTLKIGPRSPKSNQLVPPSQQCICASLVKIRPSVQKITPGNEATRTPTPTLTGSAPKTICPPPFGWGDIKKNITFFFIWKLPFLQLWNIAAYYMTKTGVHWLRASMWREYIVIYTGLRAPAGKYYLLKLDLSVFFPFRFRFFFKRW